MSESDLISAQLDAAVEIYLDGFASGITATVAATWPDLPEVARDSITEDMVQASTTDPAFMASVRADVRERIGGEK